LKQRSFGAWPIRPGAKNRSGDGSLPWSPLARGYLSRSHDEIETTFRGKTDRFADRHPYFEGWREEDQ
jgi:aryl-alcohol dehydrogenase-like predicted oxidoreductase